MRIHVFTTTLALLLSCPIWAQTDYPKWEVPVAIVYTRADFGPFSENMGGFLGGADYNFNEKFGLTFELAAQGGHIPSIDLSAAQLLIGPRFTKRTEKATYFFRGLVGSFERAQDNGVDPKAREDGEGFGLGGGIDINRGKRWAIRVFQIDYLPHKIGGNWQSNVRLGFGVVFKFGAKK